MSIKNPFANIDSEDIVDLLPQIGDVFSIKFEHGDFIGVKTFGDLCDVVVGKINLENSDDCTSQQAFYKLRQAISQDFGLSVDVISLKLLLKDIFPKENRRSKVKQLEAHMVFEFNLLIAPHWITNLLIFLLLASLAMFFLSWKIAVIGLVSTIFLLIVSHRLGNALDLKTLGELTERITKNHYQKVRRKQGTFNKLEVEGIIKDWFVEALGIDRNDLNRESQLVAI